MRNITRYISIVGCIIWSWGLSAQLPMEGWRLHTAYNNITRVEMGSDRIYGLSEGALFSVDKEDKSVAYYNRLTGLSSTHISEICYDNTRDVLVIAYQNGYIDLLQNGEVTTISDLYNSSITLSKEVNHILVHKNYAYLSMDFGIIVLNLQRQEIADTYYIGNDATAVNVSATAVLGDTVYAASGNKIYIASFKDNLVDYSYWHLRGSLPTSTGDIQYLGVFENGLYALIDGDVYAENADGWEKLNLNDNKITRIRVSGGRLLAFCDAGTWMIDAEQQATLRRLYVGAPDGVYDATTNTGWYAYYDTGIGYVDFADLTVTNYIPSGPLTNTAYRMRFNGEKLYVVPGGYLGVWYNRMGSAMIYENGTWTNITQSYLMGHIGHYTEDYSDIIGDPNDPTHFFIGSFGYGLIEFRNNEFYACHVPQNSGIESIIANPDKKYYWVDGFAYDNQNNLWMANISYDKDNVKVLTPDGKWISFNNEATKTSERLKNIIIDQQNPQYKYVIGTYSSACLGVFDDNGTLDYPTDDKSKAWQDFIDEDGNNVLPKYLHCAAQDHNGALWVGTESGVIKFNHPQNLLTSNACSRIKIARNDGSGLADYMLGDERINAIVADGANRLWFGTESSGAYLMDLSNPQDIVTLQHYTTDNSPLPSNEILSIAINPVTGEVFFGTGGGLVSYQSDAAEGKEDYSTAYAYPNPVRSNFDGVITIAGLMEDTQVRITDNGGNLVYETKSNGGLAIWDGKNGQGERVSSGVYFAMCVTADGTNKTLVKILVMN